jgi:glutamate--cysteine ligase
LKYRWLLIYLTGASPVFHDTYIEECVRSGTSREDGTISINKMNSLRNSKWGYRNNTFLNISFDSLEEYVNDIKKCIQQKELSNARELYHLVRVKASNSKDYLNDLIQHGIDYLELRMIDLNPLYKVGINKEDMYFIHLFLLYMLIKKDEPFDAEEQKAAWMNQDNLINKGIRENYSRPNNENQISMQNTGMKVLEEMEEIVTLLNPFDENYLQCLQHAKEKLLNPNFTYAEQIRVGIDQSSYINFHLKKAIEFAKSSLKNNYLFKGYEDLELSTQLLLKAAVKRGIEFELIDREENFITLKKGSEIEYVKQATKTSLDSYITALIMENKLVTKHVLKQKGIRVPNGREYHHLSDAITDFEFFHQKEIVIKPKSTNFGLGITIFKHEFSKEDYVRAFELAFQHDNTVLVEEFLSGKEYRFLVMGDEVVGILHRVPANVTGDGIHTIEELVNEKNKDPLRGKGYKTPLEKLNLGEAEKMFLKNQVKSILTIPRKDEIVYLRENSNISTGGDSIDFTDVIPDSYKKIAIASAKAAGAVFCGVDMVIDEVNEEANQTNYGIIEINFNPAIHIHCYPYKGINRKADEKILDLLFKEKN